MRGSPERAFVTMGQPTRSKSKQATKAKKNNSAASKKKSSRQSASGQRGQTATETQKNQGKSPASNQARTQRTKQMADHASLWTLLFFVFGVLLAFLILIPGENAWYFVHRGLRGTFGLAVFFLPALLIVLGIRGGMTEQTMPLKHKLWQMVLFMTLLTAWVQLVWVGEFFGEQLSMVLDDLFQSGVHLRGGGAWSVVLGKPFLLLMGRSGAVIVLTLAAISFGLILTQTSLMTLLSGLMAAVRLPVRKLSEQRQKQQERREAWPDEQDYEDNPETFDPHELPPHPVSSSRMAFDAAQNSKMDDRFRDIVRQTEHLPTAASEGNGTPFLSLQDQAPAGNIPQAPTVPANPAKIEADSVSAKEAKLSGATGKATVHDPAALDALVQKASQTPTSDAFSPPTTMLSQPPAQQTHYRYPSVSLLKAAVNKENKDLSGELRANAELLVDTLKSFGVQTRVIDISRGPTVTRYELQPSAGVKISRITGLADDIALNLASAGVRIEAPIPNKAAVGIEVPNRETDIVTIREIIDSKAFRRAESRLSVALGRDISGNEVVFDIGKMPHMLIAGATGSGKSVCINALIMSILYKASPQEVRLLMIDPKVVELGIYNGIPHLLVPVVTDPRKAAGALGWAVTEMLGRYKLFADNQVRDLSGYNQLAASNPEMDPLPQIVLIIDELADLMMAAPNEVEDAICRLAQMARAAGMHLVIATQRPSVDVITGVIKANVPSRIAFSVSSQVDSRTIIDSAGAEKLLGRGDMLFYPVGTPKPIRLQCCYVSDSEVEAVVASIKGAIETEYDETIMTEIEKQAAAQGQKGKKGAVGSDNGGGFEEEDPLLSDAISCILEAQQASTSYLQRRLKVGYARAARLMDEMEQKGVVGPSEGSKPRQILMSYEIWMERKVNDA